MIQEFKDFIAKGNVLDLAVGVVMGTAFTGIINSLVNDLISPLIGTILGGMDFSALVLTVGNAEFLVGNFINAIISFLIIAIVLFFVVKGANRMKKPEEVVEEEPAPSTEEVLLAEIRDLLKEQKAE